MELSTAGGRKRAVHRVSQQFVAHPVALAVGDEDVCRDGAVHAGGHLGPIHPEHLGDQPVTTALADHGHRVHGTRRTSPEPRDPGQEEIAQVVGYAGRACCFGSEDLLH
jgi:hypothetical protein